MTLYRLLMTLAQPVLWLTTAIGAALGRTMRGALWHRLALPMGPDPVLPGRVWLHGASLGELTSARWLIERLLGGRADLSLVVTCNSETARRMLIGWALPRTAVRLAPFDSRGAVRRFLDHWRPVALITLENELWPERVAQAQARAMPVLWIGARISERSARRWSRLAPRLIAGTLGRLRFVSAQDEASEARLIRLGLPPAAIGPRLMLKAQAAGAGSTAAPPFAPPAPRSATLLAASTHEGEEGPILDAFAAQDRFALLILAPRHPDRAAAIRAGIEGRGLPVAQRSRGEVPGSATRVYLADTLGEMPLWYRMAGATVIGGTFADRGGHTPFEPAAHGSAILHGPSIGNFAEPFAALRAGGGALTVAGPADLAGALAGLTPERQQELAQAAGRILAPGGIDVDFLAAFEAALPPAPQP